MTTRLFSNSSNFVPYRFLKFKLLYMCVCLSLPYPNDIISEDGDFKGRVSIYVFCFLDHMPCLAPTCLLRMFIFLLVRILRAQCASYLSSFFSFFNFLFSHLIYPILLGFSMALLFLLPHVCALLLPVKAATSPVTQSPWFGCC